MDFRRRIRTLETRINNDDPLDTLAEDLRKGRERVHREEQERRERQRNMSSAAIAAEDAERHQNAVEESNRFWALHAAHPQSPLSVAIQEGLDRVRRARSTTP
jgi:hypothetical protein